MLLKLLHFLLFEIFYIVLDLDLMISISHLQLLLQQWSNSCCYNQLKIWTNLIDFFLKSLINIFIEKNKLFKAIYFSLLDFLNHIKSFHWYLLFIKNNLYIYYWMDFNI